MKRILFSRLTSFIAAFALLNATATSALAQNGHHHRHQFSGAEKWAKIFDDPRRDLWQKPDAVIRALALKPGTVIADIGAGTGYFSTRFARAVPNSRVLAVDAEPAMVKYLAERAKKEQLTNLLALASVPNSAKLAEQVDLAILVDVYHHIDERARYFRTLRDSLAPGGRLAIIDFRIDSPEGPARASRVAPERVIAEMKEAGYALAETHDFLPRQYFLIFNPRKD